LVKFGNPALQATIFGFDTPRTDEHFDRNPFKRSKPVIIVNIEKEPDQKMAEPDELFDELERAAAVEREGKERKSALRRKLKELVAREEDPAGHGNEFDELIYDSDDGSDGAAVQEQRDVAGQQKEAGAADAGNVGYNSDDDLEFVDAQLSGFYV
jgi:hypothetical protein